METGDREFFIQKKAFELCYAVFRISGNAGHRHLSDHLEKQGLNLLSGIVEESWISVEKSIFLLEYLLRLAGDLNFINPSSTKILLQEIGNMKSFIQEASRSQKAEDIDLTGLFSKRGDTEGPMKQADTDDFLHRGELPEFDMEGEKGEVDREGDIHGDEDNGSLMKVAIRQSAILEKIRQFGNCQIKDLEGFFPDVSERTLRYDVQGLAEQGLIEKVGSGPGTAYRIKELASLAE